MSLVPAVPTTDQAVFQKTFKNPLSEQAFCWSTKDEIL